eukprot:TRINITY_DN364_c0_g5_i1.p2 TRINITY_DN364_c0_g5~~TRINITY_DN364_c0_g5_i1.p2  ORF type:complete len:401 (-),score=75.07 TRINITY_DN364_c0_g5_i1:37-1062(-)
MILGRSLDKSAQCSNWERRPLRAHQVAYAALDVVCLVLVYQELRRRGEQIEIRNVEVVAGPTGSEAERDEGEDDTAPARPNSAGTAAPATGSAGPATAKVGQAAESAPLATPSRAVLPAAREGSSSSASSSASGSSASPKRSPSSGAAGEPEHAATAAANNRAAQQVLAGLRQRGGAENVRDQLRFVVGGSLGTLCRKMRAVGLDTEMVDGHESSVVDAAARDARVMLTVNRRVAEQRRATAGVVVILLQSREPNDQLREVLTLFGVRVDAGNIMSRCSKCNSAAFEELPRPVARARTSVSAEVFARIQQFWGCAKCAHVYWVGPTTSTALEFFSRFQTEQ